MPEFRIENRVLLEYDGKDETVIIPDDVEIIDEMVFMGNTKIKTVILPPTIKCIRTEAFFACRKLENINLPDGIELEKRVFDSCIKLRQISDNEELIIRKIESGAFSYCKKLNTKIIFDLERRKIGDYAFSFCEQLRHVIIQENTWIGSSAFSCCIRLETISDSDRIYLEKVCRDAFLYCNKLKTMITTPDILKAEKEQAERHKKRKTKFGMKSAVIKESNMNRKDEIFEIDNGVLKKYNSKLSVVHVPVDVSEIGQEAFVWNEHITDVYFNGEITKIGKGAFLQCENLRTIELPDNIIIEERAFENCFQLNKITTKDTYVLGMTGMHAFDYCEELSNNIKIAEGTIELKDGVFDGCMNIGTVYIPDSLKELGENCFGDVEKFIFNNNADMYIYLQDQGYECEISGKIGKQLAEQIEADTVKCFSCDKRIGRWEDRCAYCGEKNPFYVDDKEMKKYEKILMEHAQNNQLPEWKSIFPENILSVEEQWLFGIHPDDETYKDLLRLEVIRKFSGRWRK